MSDPNVTAHILVTADTPVSSRHVDGVFQGGSTVLRVGEYLHPHIAIQFSDADAHSFLARLRDECERALERVPGRRHTDAPGALCPIHQTPTVDAAGRPNACGRGACMASLQPALEPTK